MESCDGDDTANTELTGSCFTTDALLYDYLIDPTGRYKAYWDWFVIMLVVHSTVFGQAFAPVRDSGRDRPSDSCWDVYVGAPPIPMGSLIVGKADIDEYHSWRRWNRP